MKCTSRIPATVPYHFICNAAMLHSCIVFATSFTHWKMKFKTSLFKLFKEVKSTSVLLHQVAQFFEFIFKSSSFSLVPDKVFQKFIKASKFTYKYGTWKFNFFFCFLTYDQITLAANKHQLTIEVFYVFFIHRKLCGLGITSVSINID